MITRYSSRADDLSESLLKQNLLHAKSYDRIAGYFSSSIFEVAGDELDSMTGKIRMICNSDLRVEDVATAQAAQIALRHAWCGSQPETYVCESKRLEMLYAHLKSGKLEVRVLPDSRFGLIHGKAGVITRADGTVVSFLGSVNESKNAWLNNYELAWLDDSAEAVAWVQHEFDMLWHDSAAVALSDFIIEDIKRLANRRVIRAVDDWKDGQDSDPAAVIVESPVYREQFGLWEHQKYFVDIAFRDHKTSYGARYVLADQVGLGKTIQLAMSAQLMALYGTKPVLIIAPKTLLGQWQVELIELLDLPVAIWNGSCWIDETGFKHPNRGVQDITKCPRKIGIVSQGLITSGSPVRDYLLTNEYECVIVDEAHRSRRKNRVEGDEYHKPDMNNLYSFLVELSKKTHSMLLATATPIQLQPIELWDLLNILSQKNNSVLGSPASRWRNINTRVTGLDLIMCKTIPDFFDPSNWEWLRNPFPPKTEGHRFSVLRNRFDMTDDQFVVDKCLSDLSIPDTQQVGFILSDGFFENCNPYIRHVVRRERSYLEDTVDEKTGQTYLQKINVELYGEDDDDALVLIGYMKDAYQLAEEFCRLLSKRVKGAGFLKSLLLKRIGSSLEAGRNTGLKLLNDWGSGISTLCDESEDDDFDDDPTDIKNLTEQEHELLLRYVNALESNHAVDPKYEKVVSLLQDDGWLNTGVIIFSQYYDTARWVAEKLSQDFVDVSVALYAGGTRSGYYLNNQFFAMSKDAIKTGVRNYEFKLMVGTDSASEGLNLQALGNLINLDLPWNPTRLEQRKGRIQRIGQINTTIRVFNMRYKDSIEDRVHHILSKRLENITSVFGQTPDTIKDVWIEMANDNQAVAELIINQIPTVHPFKARYNNEVKYIDWESCSIVLDQKARRSFFEKGWK